MNSSSSSPKRVLTVGLEYTGKPIADIEFDNLGLCRASVEPDHSAYALYDYDVIIINPASFSHFIFGKCGEFSEQLNELSCLKRSDDSHDLDSVFDYRDREKEMLAAIRKGTNVIWCFAKPRRQNFFGYRETHLGYVASDITDLMKTAGLLQKKGRSVELIKPDGPFSRYFNVLMQDGWTLSLDDVPEGYKSIASTPEGYSLGGRVKFSAIKGWMVTPPKTRDAANQLILDSIALPNKGLSRDKFHGIFLSHTNADKPFVRQLRDDLNSHGVKKVWVDEAEIEIGDTLIDKIQQGMQDCRFIGVVLSTKSIQSSWVKKELDGAMNREINSGDVVILPLLYEKCDLPDFLRGKLYADFTDTETYEEELNKLLRRLRIK